MRHLILPSRALSVLSLATLSVVGLGCDVSNLPGIGSSSDANAGMQALINALGGNAPSALHRDASPTQFRGAGGARDVDVSGACEGGGNLTFDGTLDIDGVAGADTTDFDPFDPDEGDIDVSVPTVSFDYTVDFDGCVEDGVKIDGTMSWSLRSEWDDETRTLSLSWEFVGDVEFDGEVQGSCEFDFSGDSSSDAEGWSEVDVDAFDGTVCGYDADETLE